MKPVFAKGLGDAMTSARAHLTGADDQRIMADLDFLHLIQVGVSLPPTARRKYLMYVVFGAFTVRLSQPS